MYQCAPEPEDVLATRRLLDGRSLAVFVTREEPRYVTSYVSETVEVVTEGGALRLGYERVMLVALPQAVRGFALVVTEDTQAPEKWRAIATAQTTRLAMKLFNDFEEGDDDRRARQVEGEHPARRAADRPRAES